MKQTYNVHVHVYTNVHVDDNATVLLNSMCNTSAVQVSVFARVSSRYGQTTAFLQQQAVCGAGTAHSGPGGTLSPLERSAVDIPAGHGST